MADELLQELAKKNLMAGKLSVTKMREEWTFFAGQLYLFTRPAITGYHRLGGLNNRNVFAHSSGGWKSKMKGLAGLVPLGAPLWTVDDSFWLVLLWSLLYMNIPGVSLCVHIFHSYKNTSHLGLGPTLTASF